MNMLQQSPSFYVFHKGYYVSKLGQSFSITHSKDDIKINQLLYFVKLKDER
jgi:hypothetical protein